MTDTGCKPSKKMQGTVKRHPSNEKHGVIESDVPVRTSEASAANKSAKKSAKKSGLASKKLPEERHAESNIRRLKSVREWQHAAQLQKNAIKKALVSIDKAGSGKKIVFDSESDEEAIQLPHSRVTVPKLGQSGTNFDESDYATANDSSDSGEYQDCNEEGHTIEKRSRAVSVGDDSGRQNSKKSTDTPRNIEKSQLKLFEESEEEQDEDEAEDRFRIRPEYEGATGKKLMKLQSRFGNDSRFKLDMRFAESESGEEAEAIETQNRDPVEHVEGSSVADERIKALQILEGIVGRKALHTKTITKQFKDVNALHYDPSHSDHSRFEIQDEPSTKKAKNRKKKKKQPEEGNAVPLPVVSDEKYFQVSESLREGFMDTTVGIAEEAEGQKFSLLEMFNKRSADINSTGVIDDAEAESKEQFGLPWQQPEVFDTSDEEEEQQCSRGTKSHPVGRQPASAAKTFFFTQNDPRLKEGLAFCSNSVDSSQMRADWLEKRPALVEAYLQKSKLSLRKKKVMTKRRMFNTKKRHF